MTLVEFKGFFPSAYKLTQFLRGELYFYVDSLISIFTSTTPEDLPGIFDFVKEVFSMIMKWMEIFPQYLNAFNASQQNLNLYLVDQDAALAQCGNEFFDIFSKCFGGCPRCMTFFKRFSTENLYLGNV